MLEMCMKYKHIKYENMKYEHIKYEQMKYEPIKYKHMKYEHIFMYAVYIHFLIRLPLCHYMSMYKFYGSILFSNIANCIFVQLAKKSRTDNPYVLIANLLQKKTIWDYVYFQFLFKK